MESSQEETRNASETQENSPMFSANDSENTEVNFPCNVKEINKRKVWSEFPDVKFEAGGNSSELPQAAANPSNESTGSQVESWNRANDIFDESTAKVTSSSSKDLNNHDRKFSGSGSLLDFNPPGAQYSQSVSYVVTRLKIKGELSKEQLQRKYGCTIKYTNLHAEKVSAYSAASTKIQAKLGAAEIFKKKFEKVLPNVEYPEKLLHDILYTGREQFVKLIPPDENCIGDQYVPDDDDLSYILVESSACHDLT